MNARSNRVGDSLTTIAFILAIALVIARAIQLETLRDPFEVQLNGESIARGPGAATSVVLDLLCCVPALLVLARRALDRGFTARTTIAHLLLFALALWTIASALWASDKFAASIVAFHFLGAAVLLWTISQLVRDWSQVRLIAGVCFGLLLVYVAHGLLYRFVDLPAMRESVEKNWPQILQERGWEEGSFPANQFKKKVMSGEMIGFGASPNTFAAMIVMLGFVSAGVALQRRRDRDQAGWPVVVAIALVPAAIVLWMTRSRTALATPVLGAAILLVAWNARGLLNRRRRIAFAAGASALLLMVAAIVGHGIAHGTLFHDSLTFRWRYWVGAFEIFRAHPLLGVGFENFGAHYLGVRLPIASEEVHDPHNFIVRFFVETGAIGGAFLLAWLASAWWEMTKPIDPSRDDRDVASPRDSTLRSIALLVSVAIVVNIACAVDFAQTPSYVFIEVMKRLLYGGLLLIGIVVGCVRSTDEPTLDDRPAPLLLYAMIVAIAIFFVHNLIDFSMFESGPMFVLMMLIGAVIGVRSAGARRASSRASAVGMIVVAALLWLIAAIALVAPVVAGEMLAQSGDDALRAGQPALAATKFREAFEICWIPNSDYARRAARAQMYTGQSPTQIERSLDAAVAADSMSLSALRLRANFELSLPKPDTASAIGDFERIMKLNPNDVEARIDFARALARFGQTRRAADELRRALDYDDQLAGDEPKRLSPARRDELRREIDRLTTRGK